MRSLALLTILVVAATVAAEPSPPTWPSDFTVNLRVTNHTEDIGGWGGWHNSTQTLYYSFSKQRLALHTYGVSRQFLDCSTRQLCTLTSSGCRCDAHKYGTFFVPSCPLFKNGYDSMSAVGPPPENDDVKGPMFHGNTTVDQVPVFDWYYEVGVSSYEYYDSRETRQPVEAILDVAGGWVMRTAYSGMVTGVPPASQLVPPNTCV